MGVDIGGFIKDAVSGIVAPVAGVFQKREERKQAHQTATVELKKATDANETSITLANTDVEKILAAGLQTSWKDEFITIAVVGIIPAIVLGGILQGFGYPNFLGGVLIGVQALAQIVDLKWIMTATVASGIGLSVWKKL